MFRRSYSSHIKIQVLSLLCLRAVQPFSSNVKHNTGRYVTSAMKDSFISSASFWLMATLTDTDPSFHLCEMLQQAEVLRQKVSQAKFACIWHHPMALNVCEAFSFHLQMCGKINPAMFLPLMGMVFHHAVVPPLMLPHMC